MVYVRDYMVVMCREGVEDDWVWRYFFVVLLEVLMLIVGSSSVYSGRFLMFFDKSCVDVIYLFYVSL